MQTITRILFSILPMIVLSTALAQQPTVKYTLGMSRPATHLFEIELRYENLPKDESLDVLMPVWRSGRYVIFDFAGGVQEFGATDGSNKLAWEKTDKMTWRVQTKGASTVVVTYKVYANEFGSRTRGLNDQHAFVDGSAVFMYVEKYRHLPLVLKVNPYQDWHVTTGLEASSSDGKTFTAPSFDYLTDCPLEIGNQKDFPFTVDGVPHVLSIFGDGNWNADTLVRDIAKIVKIEKDFWGEFPYKRYVFFLNCSPNAGGGTEHINSTAMGFSPFGFKNPDSSYRGFLGLVAHEFFHTWNVKQLRPKGIDPYDYTKENYTKELWVAEGTTDYYSSLMLVRGGFIPPKSYVGRTGSEINSDRSRPGNLIQSVAECSFDAWIKFWKGNQQSWNSETDYYGKGAHVSFLLDMEIRSRTANKHSLDDVMRAMWKKFPLTAGGYTLADLQKVVEETIGGSVQEFFDNYVYGVTPLDWEKYCAIAGLDVAPKDSLVHPWLGISTSDNNGRTTISSIPAGGPAWNSGLDYGDEILALNGIRVRSSTLSDRINDLKPGDKVTLTAFQVDKLRTVTITLGTAPKSYKVIPAKSPTAAQKAIYEDWLKTKW